MKKAQIQQVFIYLMALLVIGFIVIIGYRMVNKLLGQSCDIEEQKFNTQLVKSIEGAARYGSVTEAKITRPCDYERLCIVDANVFTNANNNYPAGLDSVQSETGTNNKELYPMIWANAQGTEKVFYNVYLYDAKKPEGIPVLYDERLLTIEPGVTGDPVVCFNTVAGSFSLLFKGLGKRGIYVTN
jgi:hypothetical protein